MFVHAQEPVEIDLSKKKGFSKNYSKFLKKIYYKGDTNNLTFFYNNQFNVQNSISSYAEKNDSERPSYIFGI